MTEADDGNAQAGGPTTFRRHRVRVGGLLVGCGRRERTTTTTTSEPPNDDEKGVISANYGLMLPFF